MKKAIFFLSENMIEQLLKNVSTVAAICRKWDFLSGNHFFLSGIFIAEVAL